MAVIEYISYVVVFGMWFFFSFILSVTLLLNYLSSEEWVPLERVYESCNERTAKYTYILRVYFGGNKSKFTLDGKSITIYVVNGIPDNSTRIRITSDSLKKGIVRENDRIVYKYLLLRREPLNRIKHLLVNHDSVGEGLFISRIEIQDINSAKANVAYVGNMIRSLSIDMLQIKQRYPSATKQLRELEPQFKLESKLTFSEFLSFLFLAINLIAFSCVFIIPCNQKSGLCKHYGQAFISSVFAGISSSISAILILLTSISVYICFVKYFYSKRRPHWNCIRISYLLLIWILSITFGVLAAFGYSVNILTMFAMVLAIGLLVDDAIVVVENVQRLIDEEKLSPRDATRKSMDQITGALVGIGLVLSAVFLPMAFFGGSAGAIYRQFSITMVSAMVLSVITALVLSPCLCASLLKESKFKHGEKRTGFFGFFNRMFEKYRHIYNVSSSYVTTHAWSFIIIYIVFVGALYALYLKLPTAFLPEEDQGIMRVNIVAPQGATMERTFESALVMEKYYL